MSLIYFQFLCDMTNVVSVRLILQQPSPVWKEFKIEELKLFRISSVSLFFFSANEKIVNKHNAELQRADPGTKVTV